MKRILLLSLSIMMAPPALAAGCSEFEIKPGKCVGAVTADMTEKQISALFKNKNYRKKLTHLGEGSFVCASWVYDKENTMQIIWSEDRQLMRDIKDAANPDFDGCNGVDFSKYKPQRIILGNPEYAVSESEVGPDDYITTPKWHTDKNVYLTDDPEKVMAEYGKDETISGFGWDYGGRSRVDGMIFQWWALNYGELSENMIGEDAEIKITEPELKEAGLYIGSIIIDF